MILSTAGERKVAEWQGGYYLPDEAMRASAEDSAGPELGIDVYGRRV